MDVSNHGKINPTSSFITVITNRCQISKMQYQSKMNETITTQYTTKRVRILHSIVNQKKKNHQDCSVKKTKALP